MEFCIGVFNKYQFYAFIARLVFLMSETFSQANCVLKLFPGSFADVNVYNI